MRSISESLLTIKEQMQDIEFARETLLVSINEFDEPVEKALREVINKIGVEIFVKKSMISEEEVLLFMNSRGDINRYLLDTFLKIFKLKTKLIIEQV